jgi:type I restriction-modification system DNA methylase subunit
LTRNNWRRYAAWENTEASSNTNNEGDIRKKLVEDDYVECMVALPGQLFTNTQIPACIWFLTRDKRNGLALNKTKRDRRGQFLFIDARQLGYMKDRVLRDFTPDDVKKVRARLRILVRRCLQKWKYPPDQQADAVELVLRQAESLSNEWSK